MYKYIYIIFQSTFINDNVTEGLPVGLQAYRQAFLDSFIHLILLSAPCQLSTCFTLQGEQYWILPTNVWLNSLYSQPKDESGGFHISIFCKKQFFVVKKPFLEIMFKYVFRIGSMFHVMYKVIKTEFEINYCIGSTIFFKK